MLKIWDSVFQEKIEELKNPNFLSNHENPKSRRYNNE